MFKTKSATTIAAYAKNIETVQKSYNFSDCHKYQSFNLKDSTMASGKRTK